MALSSERIGTLLTDLHAAVRVALATPQPAGNRPLRRNPKGDISQSFDLAAERCAREFLQREAPWGLLLSEESGTMYSVRRHRSCGLFSIRWMAPTTMAAA